MPTGEEKLQGHMDRNPQLDKKINEGDLNMGNNGVFKPVEVTKVGTQFKPLKKKPEEKRK